MRMCYHAIAGINIRFAKAILAQATPIHRFNQLEEQNKAELSHRDQEIEQIKIRYRAL